MSWGLGYFGQPHLLIRYMAIKSVSDIKKAKWIAAFWAIPGISGAFMVGIIAVGYFGEDFFKRTEFQIGETKCPNNHLRIVTISDTHGKHRKLTENNMLPDGDIIIHAGDFT